MKDNENFKSYLDLYNIKIAPKFKEIDILLKSNQTHSIEKISEILNISENEILNIMTKFNINIIHNKEFLIIMQNGSSNICQLLKRELECGSPTLYSPVHISYIYNLDYNKVKDAFDFLEIKKVTSDQIKLIMAQIT